MENDGQRADRFREIPLTQLRSELLASVAKIDEREKVARLEIERCATERRSQLLKLDAVDHAEKALADVYESNSGNAFQDPEAQPDVASFRSESMHSDAKPYIPRPDQQTLQSRVRIGDQRFRILHVVRLSGPVSEAQVEEKTGLENRRVKGQLQADTRLGVLSEDNGLYALTRNGQFLMDRFEDNRRSQGKPLPSVEGIIDMMPDGSDVGHKSV